MAGCCPFDSSTNLVIKLCRLRAKHLTLAFGIAAYGADYDDYGGVCRSVSLFGKFTVVFTLSLMRDYVRFVFTGPGDYEDCLAQAD
ncbi:hypothetical protein MTO96_017646 [Rhipicephalus appendiculatus]